MMAAYRSGGGAAYDDIEAARRWLSDRDVRGARRRRAGRLTGCPPTLAAVTVLLAWLR